MTKMKEKNKYFNNQHVVLAIRQKSSANKLGIQNTAIFSFQYFKVVFPILQIVTVSDPQPVIFNHILTIGHQLKGFSSIYPEGTPGKQRLECFALRCITF